MLYFLLLLLLQLRALLLLLFRLFLTTKPLKSNFYASPIKAALPAPSSCRNRKKPQWVIDKVLYLAALSGYGAGKVAELFNQRYNHHGDRVSKTFVYYQMKNQQYQIKVLRRNIKHKPPRAIPINQTWGMDLTTVTLNKQQKLVLGIVDHGSRLSIALQELKSKHSDVLLLEICRSIRQFGFPKFIRTDNEKCFTSYMFKLALKLLGIKHQTSDIASPWQNGRIERFFGTFKEKFRQLDFSVCDLQTELDIYQAWYNQIRTHQNLAGLTPAEVWKGKRNKNAEKAQWVSAWHGVLCGYYVPE
ncbi:integrase core domain-containing protein [uncultured Rheinheimera sp.]|uniref:integrase core domain-containing protein n=1 Tax=uncultured Rheinheimera sp. TaxID=400532 RepID=UPI002596DCE8|nr:integrase core domain-containing protein [uncultured Rheinheimera sp.]